MSALTPYAQHLHQDDFYVPDADIPNRTLPDARVFPDWDCVEALNIDRFAQTLMAFRHSGTIEGVKSIQDQQPAGSHISYDSPKIEAKAAHIREEIERLQRPLKILLVDGFLLYGKSVEQLRPLFNLKLFLPAPFEVVKSRREARGYVTIEGHWVDPEGYVDYVVWPAYKEEHSFLFRNGDVKDDNIDKEVSQKLDIKVCEHALDSIDSTCEWALECIRKTIQQLENNKS
jgi:nicotinamide/nicotinate riboside kinase